MNTLLKPFLFIACAIALIAALASPPSAKALDEIRKTDSGIVVAGSTTQLLGFHGATPTAQRAGSAQASVTATVGASVATTAATNSSPYGYSQTQADALVARVNQLIVDNAALVALVNELRASLVAKGLIKGSN